MSPLFDLSKFNSYKEDNRREVKAAEGGLPTSLWDTYSAMANTYGGVIICGVKERSDGSWFTTGMKNEAKLLKNFWNQINDSNKVNVNLLRETDVTTYKVGEDVIIVIEVPVAPRELKPVFVNGNMFKGTFKRNNEGDYHCTEYELKAMLRDGPRLTVDTKVLPNMSIEDFNKDSVKMYRRLLEIRRPDHVFLAQADNKFLESIGAAKIADDGKLHPTCAGLLMFGMEYKILYEYSHYLLDFREHMSVDVRWTDRIMSQTGDWSGNMFDFFYRVSAKLTLDLKKPFKLVNMVRQDETPIHDAVREALVNTLTNADFYEPRGVVIEKYPDRIILENPGTVIVGKKQMLRGGISEPRNEAVMKMFNLIGFGERAGSGVPDIYATWEQAGYAEPKVEEIFGGGQPNRTILILPLLDKNQAVLEKGHEKGHENDTQNDAAIRKTDEIELRVNSVYRLLKENPTISIAEIGRKLDLSDKQVRLALNNMKQNGRIKRDGSARSGKWITFD